MHNTGTTNRSVLITGVGKPGQLGDALLRAFAAADYTVFATGRSATDVNALVEQVRLNGGDAHAFAADLTDEASVARLLGEVTSLAGGQLSALVHAAGKYVPSGPVAEARLDAWQQAFATNATTSFLVTRDSLPLLRAAHGAIVYVASIIALPEGSPAGMPAYAVSKAALLQLMRTVADEERGQIRVYAVAPAGISTASTRAAMGEVPHFLKTEFVATKILDLAADGPEESSGTVLPLT